jgi:WD40 repeat protein
MSEIQNSTEAAVSAAEPYPSFAALRDAHRELLRNEREKTDRLAFLDKVEQFCERAYATGALLDLEEDRRAGQSLLNYWVATLYGDDRMPANTILADYDMSAVHPIADDACPYPGSRAFREEDAKNFFGRQTSIDYVLNRLKVDRMIALIGPSGRGKTSVVLAGVLPALRINDNLSDLKRFYFPLLIPGSDPLASLTEMIGNASNVAADPPRALLRNSDYLLAAIKKTTDLPAVIVVDQFEDLFTLCHDRRAQRAFLLNLLKVVQAPESKHTVIFTMQSDTRDDRIQKLSKEFGELFKSAKWVLPPLGADEIGDAIKKPADKVGLKIAEPVLLSLIKEVLSEPIGLPLMQFALRKLWAKREVNTVTEKAFKELGGCRAAFLRTADELYRELNEKEKATARFIFMKLVEVDEDNNQVTVVPVRRAALYKKDLRERVDSVLQRLIDSGLVRLTENKERDVQVELVHASLIRGWNEMAAWVGTRKSRQRLFKYAVRAAITMVIVAGAVIIAAALVGLLQDSRRRTAHELGARSNDLLKTRNKEWSAREQKLALLLGLHTFRMADDAQTRGIVLNALWQTPRPNKFLYKPDYHPGDLALSGDNKRLATFDEKGRVSIWDLEREPSVETQLPESAIASYPLVFSVDGKTLAWTSSIQDEYLGLTQDPQSNITVWDLDTGKATPLFVDAEYRVESLAFSPQGDIMLLGGLDGRIFRYDRAKKSLDQQPLVQLAASIKSISFDPNGNWVAFGSDDGSAVLWNLKTGQRDSLLDKPTPAKRGRRKQEVELTGGAYPVFVSFSQDGNLLAVDGLKGTSVWDLRSRLETSTIPRDQSGRISLFSEDSKTLTSYNFDGSLFVWDLVNNDRIGEQLYSKLEPADFIAFSNDGKILALPRDDGITLWDITSHHPLAAPAEIEAIAYAPTGTTLAAAMTDGQIILWDTVKRTQIGDLGQRPDPSQTVNFLAFNPDGKSLAVGLSRSVVFWDITTRATVAEFSGFDGSPFSLVFQPEGRTLAATYDSDTNTLTLWNVNERKRVGSLPKQDEDVSGASFDRSGSRLATAYNDGTVRIWDLSKLDGDLTPANEMGDAAVIPGATISRIAFSPDGNTLAFLIDPDSADPVGNILLWDIKSNTRIADEFSGHDLPISSIAFRADGKVLASGSADKTVIFWDTDTTGADQFCRIANSNLSLKDWNIYIGKDRKYCRICADIPAGKDAPQDAPTCGYSLWSLLWY